MTKSHSSVSKLSEAYFHTVGEEPRDIPCYYFCDNEKDANECAELVLSGDKRATASSLWWYEENNEALSKIGDLSVVTNWQGIALCVIEVVEVEIVPFNQVTREFAQCEGEGDKSLEYWTDVHWSFYQREMAGTAHNPKEDMPIVCEMFNMVYQLDKV